MASAISERDTNIIQRISRNPHIREKLIDSIAPSIWGHRHIKTGLLYSMLGGVARQTSSGHTLRGDINVLLVGDPGVGKSQFLKYVEKTFERTIYTTGKGSSAVGLTAAVRKDEQTGEWSLEGGALVLADEGICLIDEFDKMAEQDRVSIHEAMEQQSISISKAGIVATLRARCSVIAAANPVSGRYDSSLTFAENVDLSDPILSRFDILAVVRDQVHPLLDEHLAEHVVESHARATGGIEALEPLIRVPNRDPDDPNADSEVVDINASWVDGPGRIPQEILRKYIRYAREHCKPSLLPGEEEALSKFYSEIRQASSVGGGIPLTVRHLEAVIRMATANARTRLSKFVTRRDLHFAMGTMVESFIQSQKYALGIRLGKRFGRYRAIASSPDEFMEGLLLQQISRATHRLMLNVRNPRNEDDIGSSTVMQKIFDDAEVSLAQFTTVRFSAYAMTHSFTVRNSVPKMVCAGVDIFFMQLVCSMYKLPEIAIQHYVESERFAKHFKIQSNGSNEQVIRRKPVATTAP